MQSFSPEQDRAQIQQLIRPGEHLLWIGRSDPAVRFTQGDVFLIPFSVAWCAFAIFWEVETISSGGPLFFDAWGLVFVCAGLYIVAGRFVIKAKRKRRTVYALTDRRAIVCAGSGVTDQVLPKSGSSMTRRRRRGHLTVTFGGGTSSFRGFNRYGNTGLEGLFGFPAPVAFYDVADMDALETALDQVSWGASPLR